MSHENRGGAVSEGWFQTGQKEGRIRFDGRDRKIYFVIAVIISAWFAFDLLLAHFGDLLSMPDLINICVFTTYYPLMFLAPAAWLRFFDVCLYLKELKTHGYEVPADARVYDRKLAQLPRAELQIHKKKINDSVVNTAVSAVITAGFLLYNIWFLCKYHGMFLWIFNFMGLVLWIFVTLRYAGQISSVKYKDSVELDDTRKSRESVMEAMIGLFLLLLFSVAAADVMISLANVVRKARMGI